MTAGSGAAADGSIFPDNPYHRLAWIIGEPTIGAGTPLVAATFAVTRLASISRIASSIAVS